MATGSRIDVSGSGTGNGGNVMVLSDGRANLSAGAAVLARGGEAGGDGGFVELSGQGGFTFAGQVDAGALNGAPGMFLLDPKLLDISSFTSAAYNGVNNTFGNNPGGATVLPPGSLEGVTGAVALQAALDSGEVLTNLTTVEALETSSRAITAMAERVDFAVSSDRWAPP